MKKRMIIIISVMQMGLWLFLLTGLLFSKGSYITHSGDGIEDGINHIFYNGNMKVCAIGIIHTLLSIVHMSTFIKTNPQTGIVSRRISLGICILSNVSFYSCLFLLIAQNNFLEKNLAIFKTPTIFIIMGLLWIVAELGSFICILYSNESYRSMMSDSSY